MKPILREFLSFTINGRGLATNITFDGDWD